jgi:hypothetical protein
LPIRTRFTQDRRSLSRLIVPTKCSFTCEGRSWEAVVVNLSMGGAYLSSRFLPPKGALVEVTFQSRHLRQPLTLHARVIRGRWSTSDRGELSRFGVQFTRMAPELVALLRALVPDWQASDRFAVADPRPGGRSDS